MNEGKLNIRSREIQKTPKHTNSTPENAPHWRELPKQLKKLEEEGIFPLKKKSNKFPNARYFCRLCDYHCDTLAICMKHAVDNRHVRLKEAKIFERTLSFLPEPCVAQCEAITELIEKEVKIHGATQEDLDIRMEIKEELEKELQAVVPRARLEVIGSTLSGFALKSSNLDLDVELLDDGKISSALLAIKKIVENNKDRFTNVVNHLSTSYPSMSFTHEATGVQTVVGCSKFSSWKTNKLLYYYNTLDERVKPLTLIFKYWAKLCSMCNQNEGSLSAHCFPIMAIHFLQQTKPPVLPVLQMRNSKDGDAPSYYRPDELDPPWKSTNTCSIGELWVQMFRYYAFEFKSSIYVITLRNSVPYVRTESRWGKKLAIEDPFHPKKNITYTVSSATVFDFIANNFRSTYKYFVIPQLEFGCLFKSLKHKPNDLSLKKCSLVEPAESDGEEDPDKKVTPAVVEEEEEDEEVDKVVNGVSEGKENEREEGQEAEEEELQEDVILCDLKDPSVSSEPEEEGKTAENSAPGDVDEDVIPTPPTPPPASAVYGENDLLCVDVKDVKTSLGEIPRELAEHLMNQVTKEMLHYRFVKEIFTGGESLPLFCTVCQRAGHTKSTCLENELPPLAPLPSLKRSYLDMLSAMFYELKNECSPSPRELWERDHLVDELQGYIKQFFPDAVLKLFGSSVNGFGFGNSDLDICMTFEGKATGEGIDHIKIIEELAEKLKKFRECRMVLAITTAKVPIVKFSLKRAQLEVDLSLYNTLALQNTKLLSAYAAIDFRVKVLGYTIKYFAKICDIGDASRGSLSSYAYILMLLHYLQQCDPPVIPVLQKIHDLDKPRPELLIDGWDAWFYEDVSNLSKVWPHYRKNKQSVGELWVNLLRYYTEKFDWKENVITIRQAEPLSKLEKLWTARCIAIEDPFDLGHNLGGGLSRNMNTFILKAFIRGRGLFGYGFEIPPRGYGYLGSFLFDRNLLTDGTPPNDRGCRWCGCIGHMVKECPRKLQRKERNRDSHKDNKPGSPAKNASPLQPKPREKSLSVPPPPSLASNKVPGAVGTSAPASGSTTATTSTAAGSEKTSTDSTKKQPNKDVTCVPKAKRKMNRSVVQKDNVKDVEEKRPIPVSRPQEIPTAATFGPSPTTETMSSSSSPSCSSQSSPTASQTDTAGGSDPSPAPHHQVSEGSDITPSLLFRLASQAKSGSLVLPAAANLPKGIPPPPPGFGNQPNPPGNFPWGNANLPLGIHPSSVSGMIFGPTCPQNNLSSSPDRENRSQHPYYPLQQYFPSQMQPHNSPQQQFQMPNYPSSQLQQSRHPFPLNQLSKQFPPQPQHPQPQPQQPQLQQPQLQQPQLQQPQPQHPQSHPPQSHPPQSHQPQPHQPQPHQPQPHQPQPQHALQTQQPYTMPNQVQMFEQHAQLQQQMAQQQIMLQFQQMQLRARALHPPNLPTRPFDGNFFISHVMGSKSRGSQETPTSVGPNFGMWMPPPPPGIVPDAVSSSQSQGGPNYPSNLPLAHQTRSNLHQINMGVGFGNPNQFPDVVMETILAGAESSQFNSQPNQHNELPIKQHLHQNVASLSNSQELSTSPGSSEPNSRVEDDQTTCPDPKELVSGKLQETNVASEFF